MESLTIPQQRYEQSCQKFLEAVNALEILDKQQSLDFMHKLLRGQKLDPDLLMDSWPAVYGFSDFTSFLRTASLVYRSTLSWPKPYQSVIDKFANKLTGRTAPTNSLSESELLSLVYGLNYRNNLEIYLNFSASTQLFSTRLSRTIFKADLHAIMEMMRRMNLDLNFYPVQPNDVMDFLTHMKSVAISNGVEDKLHFQQPGSKMADLLINTHNPFNSEKKRIEAGEVDLPLMILTMFSVYFTEDVVMEASDHFGNANVVVSFDTMLTILDQWDELKSYPAEWIKHTVVV